MSDTNLTETAYVSRELFEAREAKNQAEVHSELKELDLTLKSKIDTLDAKVDKLNITLNARMDILNTRMDVLNARLDGVEASLSMKIDKVEESLSTAMEGLIDRFQDMKEHQKNGSRYSGFYSQLPLLSLLLL